MTNNSLRNWHKSQVALYYCCTGDCLVWCISIAQGFGLTLSCSNSAQEARSKGVHAENCAMEWKTWEGLGLVNEGKCQVSWKVTLKVQCTWTQFFLSVLLLCGLIFMIPDYCTEGPRFEPCVVSTRGFTSRQKLFSKLTFITRGCLFLSVLCWGN